MQATLPCECPDLDEKIAPYVQLLRKHGVETYESCQGGEGHHFLEPTIQFHGMQCEGYRAVSIALMHGLPVKTLRRFWRVIEKELEGPTWEMTFLHLNTDCGQSSPDIRRI